MSAILPSAAALRSIHREHGELDALLQVLEQRAIEHRPIEELVRLFELIRSQLLAHFESEEQIMVACEFDPVESKAHEYEHERLIRSFDEILHRLNSGVRGQEICDWVHEHLLVAYNAHRSGIDLRLENALIAASHAK